jgi:hypothetical protein
MINMASHPTPGIPLQSEHSLDKNGLQFSFIASLINENKIIYGVTELRQRINLAP